MNFAIGGGGGFPANHFPAGAGDIPTGGYAATPQVVSPTGAAPSVQPVGVQTPQGILQGPGNPAMMGAPGMPFLPTGSDSMPYFSGPGGKPHKLHKYGDIPGGAINYGGGAYGAPASPEARQLIDRLNLETMSIADAQKVQAANYRLAQTKYNADMQKLHSDQQLRQNVRDQQIKLLDDIGSAAKKLGDKTMKAADSIGDLRKKSAQPVGNGTFKQPDKAQSQSGGGGWGEPY